MQIQILPPKFLTYYKRANSINQKKNEHPKKPRKQKSVTTLITTSMTSIDIAIKYIQEFYDKLK